MKRPPAVIVHGLNHARLALAAGLPVTLLSGHGAGWHAGPAWWMALVAAARAAHPTTSCTDILDCADYAGAAMAALRLGQPTVLFDPASPAFAVIGAIATVKGVALLGAPPPALDLAEHGAAHRLPAWLADVAGEAPGGAK